MDYDAALTLSGLLSLYTRREKQTSSFFKKIQQPNDKLFHLRQHVKVSENDCYNLRNKKKYKLPLCKTDRYKQTFLPYCLYNFQQ